jgi:hypothetical protein
MRPQKMETELWPSSSWRVRTISNTAGEKKKHDDASHYPKSADALLKQATEKLTSWSLLINAPVFLIGGGTPHKVIPMTDVPDVGLDVLDKFGYERKIEMMALARARICAWLTYNCKNDDWDRFNPNAVHYVEKPLLEVRYPNIKGHHGKIENYLQELAIRNTVSYPLQRSKIMQDLQSKSPSRKS